MRNGSMLNHIDVTKQFRQLRFKCKNAVKSINLSIFVNFTFNFINLSIFVNFTLICN